MTAITTIKNRYKTNFLKKVVLRLDFEQAQLSQLPKLLKEENFKKYFPIGGEKKGEEGMIDIDFKTKKVNQVSNPITTWEFRNEKDTKKFIIHPRFLVVEYKEYSDSKELLIHTSIVSNFIKNFDIKTINRLGLRYVNEIVLQGKDFLSWDEYIDEKLLGSLKFAISNKKILSRAMSTMVFKEENNNINFSYGIWNSNYPAEIREKIFILDFDASSKYPIDAKEADLSSIVKEYNQNIENIFENTIKEGLRKILKK